MNKITENSLKDDAFKWAEYEFSHDPAYWKDRSQNGNGLIKQIADFVLLHGSAEI